MRISAFRQLSRRLHTTNFDSVTVNGRKYTYEELKTLTKEADKKAKEKRQVNHAVHELTSKLFFKLDHLEKKIDNYSERLHAIDRRLQKLETPGK